MQAPTREAQIEQRIKDLSGEKFEGFCVELLRREYYPSIIPTSATYDGGSDANTYESLVTLQNGRRVKVAASHTGDLGKLTEDCKAIAKGGDSFDILVFATSRDIRTDTQQKWVESIKSEFGWDLEVHPIRSLVPVAAQDKYEKFVYERLGIPPLGGDFLSDIRQKFDQETQAGLRNVQINLPGSEYPLPRQEVGEVWDQLAQFKPILLLGKGGEGKTGIAILVIQSSPTDLPVLYLDARRFAAVTNKTQFREHFDLNGEVGAALAHLAATKGCLLVVDQLDNVAGTLAGHFLIEFLLESAKIPQVEILAISRRPIDNENNFLEMLSGFVTLEARALGETTVRRILEKSGITEPTDQLIKIADNLLNLSFILQILQPETKVDLGNVQDEVGLWNLYRQSIVAREGEHIDEKARNVVAEAVHLAAEGLKSDDRSFMLDYPPKGEDERLISRGVIIQVSGRKYRFQHEKVQDYFYAWDAVECHKTVDQVTAEVGALRAPVIIQWMSRLLEGEPKRRVAFLKSILEQE